MNDQLAEPVCLAELRSSNRSEAKQKKLCDSGAVRSYLVSFSNYEGAYKMGEYKIELEIFEGNAGQLRTDGTYPDLAKEGICAWMYGNFQVGQKFNYPEDLGKLCPWLVDSLTGVIRALENGGTLPWRYKGTPYEKVIDQDGMTTEFVRCLDPTASGIVMKVIRTSLQE